MSTDHLRTVLAAWDANGEVADGRGWTDAELAQAEVALGFALPTQLRSLSTRASTFSVGYGDLNILPLLPAPDDGDSLSLTKAFDWLRPWQWQWPIPPQMVIFGDNGGGGPHGLWVDPRAPTHEPIVGRASVFRTPCPICNSDGLTAEQVQALRKAIAARR